MTTLDQARQRVERSRWIPTALLALLLAYGCTVARQQPRDHTAETESPTVKKK